MTPTHFLITAENYAIVEKLIIESYGEDQTVLDDSKPISLSPLDIFCNALGMEAAFRNKGCTSEFAMGGAAGYKTAFDELLKKQS